MKALKFAQYAHISPFCQHLGGNSVCGDDTLQGNVRHGFSVTLRRGDVFGDRVWWLE